MIKLKLQKNIQNTLITSPTNFPSGLSIKTDKGTYWIKDGKRFKLISDRAAASWAFTTINATENALSTTKLAGKLGFRDGSLIRDISDGKMYLISQNKKRHITSPDIFEKYGLDRKLMIEVSSAEANAHELGEDL